MFGKWGRISRRNMMKMAGSAGFLSMITIRAGATNGSSVVISDFENGLGGWETNGGNELTLANSEQEPFAVQEGENALKITSDGDPYPLIENRKSVRGADFVNNPYLLADVLLGDIEELSGPVEFKFRFHYKVSSNKNGKGNRVNKSRQKKPALVEESPTITFAQLRSSTIAWDMTDIDDRKLANPKRLEIAWRRSSSSSPAGPRGRGPGKGFRGEIFLDNIRLTDDVNEYSSNAIALQLAKLKAENGAFEYAGEFRNKGVERGRFVYDNGTEIPVKVETVGEGQFRYTINGESYRIGGGW